MCIVEQSIYMEILVIQYDYLVYGATKTKIDEFFSCVVNFIKQLHVYILCQEVHVHFSFNFL
jgi:hypothetical protein